jgi:hypothetical protein
MESLTFNSTNTEEDREEKAVRSGKPAKLSLYSGIIILIGGAAAPVFGSLLIAASWLIGHHGIGYLLHRAGSILLVLTIPLFIVSAFLLDAYEKRGGRIDLDG